MEYIIGQKNIDRRLLAIYARGSNCNEKVESIIAKYKQDENIEIVGVYIDDGKSGSKIEGRFGLLQLMDDCRARKINEIHTMSMDQLSRNISDAQTLLQELKTLGIIVVYELEGISTSSKSWLDIEKLIAEMVQDKDIRLLKKIDTFIESINAVERGDATLPEPYGTLCMDAELHALPFWNQLAKWSYRPCGKVKTEERKKYIRELLKSM